MNMTSALVLAVPHQLQGPNFRDYVQNSTYSVLIEDLIRDGVDFVFEEVSGRGPSIAEDLANSMLQPGHYLDVDPRPDERPRYGIARVTGGGGPVDPGNSEDIYESSMVDEQRKREELWVQRIRAQKFEKGLVVVGLAHGLSLSFRLISAGISAPETRFYVPYNKLCKRRHRT
jgi:hypothetical protein